MNIKELKISNVLSFSHSQDPDKATSISFDPALNILIGGNGSGKSTALEVINLIFKKIFFRQVVFNQDSYSVRSSLTAQKMKDILSINPNRQINNFRLDPQWGCENHQQKVRLSIQLDDIDKKNIETLTENREKLLAIAATYSNNAFSPVSWGTGSIDLDITLSKSSNTCTHQTINDTEASTLNYLANYNYYKELIRIHNLENESDPIPSLFEPFALIPSFRNYHSFTGSVSLQSKTGYQQVRDIQTQDYGLSMNSSDNNEPSIFSLVRLHIANKFYELNDLNLSLKECEAQANKMTFLQSINDKLKLVNLSCKIRITDKRTWQFSFEFTDIKRNKALTNINSLSAGQKSIIHLVFEAYGRGDLNGGLVIIDEPEIHLHYQFQHEYLRLIKDLNREQKCQYILVTHSESLIDSNTIQSVKRFTLDDKGQTQIVSPELSTEQKTLIKILDNTRATYSLFGKTVVLVEGDSDRYFFKSALQIINPSLSQEISFIDIDGKGSFKAWRDFFQSYGLKVYCIGDFDNVSTLALDGPPLISKAEFEKTKAALRQSQLDNLTENQKKTFKDHYDKLIQFKDFLTKPPVQLWQSLFDKFKNLSKVKRAQIDKKIQQDHPFLGTAIESQYAKGIFILKKGDLEHYLGLSSKGLPGVIDFCHKDLESYILSPKTDEAKEIRKILETIAQPNS